MLETTTGLLRTDPERLARVFAEVEDTQPPYSRGELGAILRHQLETRVEFDLSRLDAGSQRLLRAAAVLGEAGGIRTFQDLFTHPDPPIQLLQMTRDYAKGHLSHPESPLPAEISMALYYASIVTAWVRLGRRITWLSREELARGIGALMEEDWLDTELRRLFERGLGEILGAAPA